MTTEKIGSRDGAIRRWWNRLLLLLIGKPKSAGRIPWPTREEIALLPLFDSITLERIEVISTPDAAREARRVLSQELVLGFDTESKPIFIKGQTSTGPHVAQFSTLTRAYVFILHHNEIREAVAELIASETIKKVGFGLSEDLRRIPIKFRVQPKSVCDLESVLSAKGFGKGIGVKVAVAMVFKKRFLKSKKASTSNWMNRELSEKQLLYAANDAYAAIRVFEALSFPTS